MATIYELASTRTRVSFEAGMYQLGGTTIFLNPQDTHLGRGEPIRDTARVLSKMVDLVMIRARRHETLEEFAEASDVPVINGMSDLLHPCQLLADVQTFVECRGSIDGANVAFVGDGFNLCNSFMEAAGLFDFQLRISTPPSRKPKFLTQAQDPCVTWHSSPREAVDQADLVVTDVWTSMAQEGGSQEEFDGFQVNDELMELAAPRAIFMHCLPAHRGEEVTDSILESDSSVVWEEAGNRLHAQKSLIEFLLRG